MPIMSAKGHELSGKRITRPRKVAAVLVVVAVNVVVVAAVVNVVVNEVVEAEAVG
jgi:hypothetical protein